MSQFCSQCGKEVDQKDRFCERCGNPVRPPDTGRKPSPPQPPEQVKNRPTFQGSQERETPAGSTRKPLTAVKIVTMVLLGLALVFGAWHVERKVTADVDQQLSQDERFAYAEAVTTFTNAIEVEPRNEQAHLGLAEAYLGLEEIGKAIEVLEEGLAQTGSDIIRNKLDELLITRNEETDGDREAVHEIRNGEEIPIPDSTEVTTEVRPFQYEDLTFHVFKPIQIEEEVKSLLGEPVEMVDLGFHDMAGVNVRSLVYDDVTIETLAYGAGEFPVERIHIQERLILGPRNIRVGDSLESVLALFPDDSNEIESVWGNTYRRFLYGNEDDFYYYDGRYDNFAEVAYLTYDQQKEPTALHFLLVNGTSFFHEVELVIENRYVEAIKVFHGIYY